MRVSILSQSTTGKHTVKVSVEPDAAPANDSKTLEIFTEATEPFAIYQPGGIKGEKIELAKALL